MKSNQGLLAIGLTATVFIVIAIYLFLGQGYGKVSEQTYQFSQALYGACQTKSEERLDRVEQLLDGEKAAAVPEREMKWLRKIVQLARNGNWDAATSRAKRMMEDQVEF